MKAGLGWVVGGGGRCHGPHTHHLYEKKPNGELRISSGMDSRADDSALQPCSVPRVRLHGVQLHEVVFGHDADRALHLPHPPAKVLVLLGATKQRDEG